MQALLISTPFFGLILLGYISARCSKIPEQGLTWMNFFVLYLALPALLFQMLRKTPIEGLKQIDFILANTGSTTFMYMFGLIIALFILKRTGKEAVAFGFASSYSNIGYMGVPLVISALGVKSIVPVALIFSMDNAMFFILTPALMAIYSAKNIAWYATILRSIKAVIIHPFIIATIAGIFAAAIKLPVPHAIDNLLNMLQSAAAPCALFSMGISIGLRKVKLGQTDIGIALVLKLFIHPALVYFVMQLIPNIEPTWLYAAVLMAALPPATNIFILSQQYNIFVNRASTIIVIGTLVAIFSVTTILYMIKNQML